MKKIFFINLALIAFASVAFSQSPCACCSNAIQSPAVAKPAEAIVSVNCSQLIVKWKGKPGQAYEVTVTSKEAATNKVINTASTANITSDNNQNYTAAIAVKPGTKLSWSVQAIGIVGNRKFYSYPLRSGKDYVIPNCETPVATTDKASKAKPLANEEQIKVHLFPNPVRWLLNINLDNISLTETLQMRIFNADGKAVIHQKITQGKVQADVRQLVPGSYFISIERINGQVLFKGKFVKE